MGLSEHLKNVPPLTRDDFKQVGYCDHGRRELRQGISKKGNHYRADFCPINECEGMWWRLIGSNENPYWVTPEYEPMRHAYVGMNDERKTSE